MICERESKFKPVANVVRFFTVVTYNCSKKNYRYEQILADRTKPGPSFHLLKMHLQHQGARYLTGDNLKLVWAEFSTLS